MGLLIQEGNIEDIDKKDGHNLETIAVELDPSSMTLILLFFFTSKEVISKNAANFQGSEVAANFQGSEIKK